MLVFERVPQTRRGGASTSFLLGLVRAFFIIRIDGEGAVPVARVEENDQQSGAERGDAAAQPCWRAPLLLHCIMIIRLPLPALSYSETEACGGY